MKLGRFGRAAEALWLAAEPPIRYAARRCWLAKLGGGMQVRIKQFDVNMEVKSSGIEFEVRSPDGSKQLGDCYVTMTGLVWCKGKTSKQNGVKISWRDFIDYMESA